MVGELSCIEGVVGTQIRTSDCDRLAPCQECGYWSWYVARHGKLQRVKGTRDRELWREVNS